MPTEVVWLDGQAVLPQARTGTTIDWEWVDGQLGGLPADQPSGTTESRTGTAEGIGTAQAEALTIIEATGTAVGAGAAAGEVDPGVVLPVLIDLQQGAYVSTPFTLTLTGLAADDYIIVTSQYTGSASGTLTVTDDQGHTYTRLAMQDGAQDGSISYAKVVSTTGGAVVVTVTRSSATGFYTAAYGVRNIHPDNPLDFSAQFNDTNSSNTHYSAATGIETDAGVFIVTHGRCTSTVSTTVAGPDYTAVYTTQPNLLQYKIAEAAILAERGEWASTGTQRPAFSFMAGFRGASAGPIIESATGTADGIGSAVGEVLQEGLATGLAAGLGSALGYVQPDATLTQTRYRWRNDDGSEITATWAASENTPLAAASGIKRLRVQLAATDDPIERGLRLESRPSGGSWLPVGHHPLEPPNHGPHTYWKYFAQSPYRLYACSCRNQVLDDDYLGPTEGAARTGEDAYSQDISYDYVNDSHVRKQDAAKLYLLTNSASQYRPEMLINAGTEIPFRGKVLVMWDAWWDETWQTNRIAATGDTLLTHKCFQIGSKYDNSWRWAEFRMGYANATAPDIATVDMRQYAEAHIGPNAYLDGDALKPQLASFTVKANTWTRWYVLIEFMRPDETYDRISWWIADENTDPVHLFDRLQYNTGMGSPSSVPLGAACPLDPHLKEFWFEFNTSQSGTPSGPLISYMRNFLALNVTNISSEDFPRLLVRPVA